MAKPSLKNRELNRQLAEDKVAPNGLQWEDGRLTLLT